MSRLAIRFEAVRGSFKRPWVKWALGIWACIAAYDTFLSQLVPEPWAQKAPKIWMVAATTGGMLTWWQWILILALIVTAASIEYAARKTEGQTGKHETSVANGVKFAPLFHYGSEKEKDCPDCEHYDATERVPVCVRNRNVALGRYWSCHDTRADPDLCGHQAKWFAAKAPPVIPVIRVLAYLWENSRWKELHHKKYRAGEITGGKQNAMIEEFRRAAKDGQIIVEGRKNGIGSHEKIPVTFWLTSTLDHTHMGGMPIRTIPCAQNSDNIPIYHELQVRSADVYPTWPKATGDF